jgi:antitoxin component HigA of HigAB toxin-antitoxin module
MMALAPQRITSTGSAAERCGDPLSFEDVGAMAAYVRPLNAAAVLDQAKLQNCLFEATPRKRKPGPAPNMRATPYGQALLSVFRAQASLSNQELARRMGCSDTHLSNVLSGTDTVTTDLAMRLWDTLVSPRLEVLIGRDALERRKCWADRAQLRSSVALDGLVLVGFVPNPRLLRSRFAEWLQPYTYRDRGSDIAERVRVVELRDSHGALRTVHIRPSRIDLCEPPDKYLRYHVTYEVSEPARYGSNVLALISHGPYRGTCPAHYGQPKERCARCEAKDRADWWKCRTCHGLNACAACDEISASKPHLRFQGTGDGCWSDLLAPMAQTLFTPYVAPGSVEVDLVHIALDMNLPYDRLVPFQKARLPGKRGFRAVKPYWKDAEEYLFASGVYLGSESSPTRVVVYDKWLEAQRHRFEPLPPHIRFSDQQTRIEFRLRPRRVLDDASPEGLFARLPRVWDTIGLIDLRDLDSADPVSCLVECLPFFPMTNHAPSEARLRKIRRRPGDKPDRSFIGELLQLSAGVPREHAVDRARAIHARVRATLIEQERSYGIPVGATVTQALAALQAQLDAACAPPSPPGAA